MKTIFAGFLLCISLALLPAAEITVPRLEMATLGKFEGGELNITPEISADLALNGGYKYNITLGFGLDAGNILQIFNFRTARASARSLFELPLDFTYFIGEGDDYCTGEEFSTRFGYDPIGTDFKGFFYFPRDIRYNGIHGARGTGFSLSLTRWNMVIPMIYLYGNTPALINYAGGLNETLYSGDLRFLFDFQKTRMEAFSGVSFNTDKDVTIRGGILAHFASGNNVEFLLQGGIPGWTLGNQLNIDNFFFLMEPRIYFGSFGLFFTFFYHPVIYLDKTNDLERGKADLNTKFFFQKPNSEFTAGLESTMGMKIDRMEDFSLFITPFAGFISGGLRWEAKLRINILEMNPPLEMFELFFGVRTSF